MQIKISGRLGNQQGAIIATVVWLGLIPMSIVLLAFVFDLGHLHSVRQELQNAAEAGALAGTRALFPLPGDSPSIKYPYCDRGRQTARDVAALNKSDTASSSEQPVTVLVADAQLIRWEWGNVYPSQANTIYPIASNCDPSDTGSQVNGIKVTARRDSSAAAGPVFSFFYPLLKNLGVTLEKDTADVVVSATAAAGYATKVQTPPFTVDKTHLDDWKLKDPYGTLINFMTPSGNPGNKDPDVKNDSGWSAAVPYDPTPANVSDWLSNGTSPFVEGPPNGSVNLINGNTSNFKNLADALAKNYDTTLGGWLVVVAVVNVPAEDTNYNHATSVLGFQPIIITTVDKKQIGFKIYYGDVVTPGTNPGGATSQVYTLPKLVE
jgi:hypothetical protein